MLPNERVGLFRGAAAYSLRQVRRVAIAVMEERCSWWAQRCSSCRTGSGGPGFGTGAAVRGIRLGSRLAEAREAESGDVRAGAARYVPLLRQRRDP
jgi:hypothetical protein